jgi:LysM repeat protein
MADGGNFPWKRQVIDSSRGPTADFSCLRKPLPKPLAGVKWEKDGSSNEWKIVPDDNEKGKDGGKATGSNTAFRTTATRKATKFALREKERDADKIQDLVENVDFVYHTVLPSDTFAGLCLRYGVSATKLRQANRFSGTNLLLAPSKLIIPISLGSELKSCFQFQDTESPEFKLQTMLHDFPHLSALERKAYLELNDWNLIEARKNAADDEAWEASKKNTNPVTRRLLQQHRSHAVRKDPDIFVAIPVVRSPHSQKLQTESSTRERAVDELMEPLLLKSELEMARLC